MKRIVTFVVPVGEDESTNPVNKSEGSPNGAHAPDDGAFDPAAMPPGAMRVEVIVGDIPANRIIAMILSQGGGESARTIIEPASGDLLEKLVAKELEVAEPDAQDLLERIVHRVERQLISQVYSDCDHVKSRAAARLGINRNTLLKKLRQFGQIGDEETADPEPDA